jgi:hypothetical protein
MEGVGLANFGWNSVSAGKCTEILVERAVLLGNEDDVLDVVNTAYWKSA